MTSKPSTTRDPDTDRLAVPGSAVLVARLGGTAALLAAAAISASTLYRLGLHVGLVPTIAWLLPAALDIYAACAIFTGYRIPSDNPACNSALWNARVALALTVGCNALEHVLSLAASAIPPAVRDGLLVTVASLPPLIVERLLYLQTLLAPGRPVGRSPVPASVNENDGVDERPTSLNGQNDHLVQAETDPINHRPLTSSRRRPATVGVRGLEPPVLAEIATPVYAALAERSGHRPGERVFHQALTDRIAALADGGQIPPDVRPPSLSTAKRVRALIEDVQTLTKQAPER